MIPAGMGCAYESAKHGRAGRQHSARNRGRFVPRWRLRHDVRRIAPRHAARPARERKTQPRRPLHARRLCLFRRIAPNVYLVRIARFALDGAPVNARAVWKLTAAALILVGANSIGAFLAALLLWWVGDAILAAWGET